MEFINALAKERIGNIKPCEIDTWTAYADSVYYGLSRKCIDDSCTCDYAMDIQPILDGALRDVSRLSKVGEIFDRIKSELHQQIHTLFKSTPDVLIVLYLGLCNGAGWATRIEDQRVILLGAEKILELNWDSEERMKALIYHEVGHVWHDCEGFLWHSFSTPDKMAIRQLYREGMAMVFEQMLCQNMDYYHQGGAWSEWCKEHLYEIKTEYMKRITHGESVREFYGDWNEYKGYSDVGYYLGAQFIKHLMKKFTFREIASLSYEEIYKRFKSYVFSG